MTTEFNSFDASPMGAFVASQFGDARNRPRGDKVLLWLIDSGFYADIYFGLVGIYDREGIVAHVEAPGRAQEWTGNLSDYRLVIWPIATRNPIWFAQIPGWAGRIVITAEYSRAGDRQFDGSIDYVNALGVVTGITLNHDVYNESVPAAGPILLHPLTNGIQTIFYAATSTIASGGRLLARTISGPGFLAANRLAAIDWVVSGDSNPFASQPSTGDLAGLNSRFLLNLYAVPI